MVQLKVRKIGNSLGVVLPKEIVHALNTREGEMLYLAAAPDGGFTLTQRDVSFEEKMAKAEDIMQRYRDTLHVLSQ